MLEYHNKNVLSGDNASRSEYRISLLKYLIKITASYGGDKDRKVYGDQCKETRLEGIINEMFDSMRGRDATPEEQKSVTQYIDSISKPTGVNLFELIK